MNDNLIQKMRPYAPVVVRVGMSLIFLMFSWFQFSNPSMWTGFVPSGVSGIVGGNAALLVLLNAWFELIFGLALLAGLQVRAAALLLAAHLLGIAVTIGFSPLGVRDLGLAVATLSIFFAGPDIWSVDSRFSKPQTLPVFNQ